MQKKSGQVALGGIATGMCIALMFATGMIPFSYYALPALAGLVLIAVREENGLSTALIVFAAVIRIDCPCGQADDNADQPENDIA